VVLSANDTQIKNASSLVSFVQSNGEQNIRLHIQRNETTFVADIKPQKIQNDAAPRMGVSLADAGIVRFPWYSAFYKGLVAAALGFLNVFVSFFILIKGLVLGNGLLFGVSGPVGIAVAVGESARMGFNYLLNVTAMISLSLAALNVLPIPALDGGRALFVIIEKITKRKVSVRTEQIIHTIGFVALLAMILFITFKDIKNLL
jgi:regulator of sigma E protease